MDNVLKVFPYFYMGRQIRALKNQSLTERSLDFYLTLIKEVLFWDHC